MRTIFRHPVILFGLLFSILVYTRFVGLGWGLPYPMHPDERNMTIAILQFSCDLDNPTTCFHPHFFAYGQLPLYFAYIIAQGILFLTEPAGILTFEQVTIALRLISASASVGTAIALFVFLRRIRAISASWRGSVAAAAILIFAPVMIQFAHFGTTESLLMFFAALLLLRAQQALSGNLSMRAYAKSSGVILGLALATKLSALPLGLIPAYVLCWYLLSRRSLRSVVVFFFGAGLLAGITVLFFILGSPFNVIDFPAFLHSMNYESAVGLGTYKAFYTRQFEYTLPYLFQMIHVFPYALGWPIYLLSLIGLVAAPWNRHTTLLRLCAIAFFLSSGFMYAKWTRFLAIVYPFLLLFALIGWVRIIRAFDVMLHARLRIIRYVIIMLLGGIAIVPGIAFLRIYQTPDVRFVASQWIYQQIPTGVPILSETANVVDIPIPNQLIADEDLYGRYYSPISFNFYELDNDPIAEDLFRHLETVEYIFVPSRRIFFNHTCYLPQISGIRVLSSFTENTSPIVPVTYGYGDGFSGDRCEALRAQYPLLSAYYDRLFDGTAGFIPVAEFSSYPRIELFGRTLIEFPDERAEETWTVFDHPVIRLYRRAKPDASYSR